MQGIFCFGTLCIVKKLIFFVGLGLLLITAGVVLVKSDWGGQDDIYQPVPEVVDDVSVPTSTSTPPTPSVSPTPTPIPTPDPVVYGPCKNVPVALYHHVQPNEEASLRKQTSISVDSKIFAEQMVYLSSRGYNTITADQLLSVLTGTFPSKPILLTFDDGYADFYTYAYPELVKNNLRATVFLSTGLMGGGDYLTWEQIKEMAGSGLVTFGNHTWSHKNLGAADEDKVKYEIETAQQQLLDNGLGPVTSFAYPYGLPSSYAESILKDLGIKTAFTTIPGNIQCAKLPFAMRRSRIGSVALSYYGF